MVRQQHIIMMSMCIFKLSISTRWNFYLHLNFLYFELQLTAIIIITTTTCTDTGTTVTSTGITIENNTAYSTTTYVVDTIS
jgi:hypothetical protein